MPGSVFALSGLLFDIVVLSALGFVLISICRPFLPGKDPVIMARDLGIREYLRKDRGGSVSITFLLQYLIVK